MLLVPTYLGRSKINGLGLFSSGPIKCGAIISIWDAQKWGNIYTINDLLKMPVISSDFIKTYGWLDEGTWHLETDNGKFVNHSRKPNSVMEKCGRCVASKDIYTSEEITIDYTTFCVHCVKEKFSWL